MAHGRHSRPGLLARLWPGRAARRRAELDRVRRTSLLLHGEVERLRALGTRDAGRAAAADLRARRAEEQVEVAQRELADLRLEVLRLREELLWAFAEGRLPTPAAVSVDSPAASAAQAPGAVIDLRPAARPA